MNCGQWTDEGCDSVCIIYKDRCFIQKSVVGRRIAEGSDGEAVRFLLKINTLLPAKNACGENFGILAQVSNLCGYPLNS